MGLPDILSYPLENLVKPANAKPSSLPSNEGTDVLSPFPTFAQWLADIGRILFIPIASSQPAPSVDLSYVILPKGEHPMYAFEPDKLEAAETMSAPAIGIIAPGESLPLARLFGPNADLRAIYFSTADRAVFRITPFYSSNGKPLALITEDASAKRFILEPDKLVEQTLTNGHGFGYKSASGDRLTKPISEIVGILKKDTFPQDEPPAKHLQNLQKQDPAGCDGLMEKILYMQYFPINFLRSLAEEKHPGAVCEETGTQAVLVGTNRYGYRLLGDGACDISTLFSIKLRDESNSGEHIESIAFRTTNGEVCLLEKAAGAVKFTKRGQRPEDSFSAVISAESLCNQQVKQDDSLILGYPFKIAGQAVCAPISEIVMIREVLLSDTKVQELIERKIETSNILEGFDAGADS